MVSTVGNFDAGRSLFAGRDVQNLLAVFGLRQNLVFGNDEAPPRVGRHDQSAARHVRHHFGDVGVVGQVHHQAQRLAMAPPARQLVTRQGIKATVGGEHQNLIRGLRVKGKASLVALFEFQVLDLLIGDVTFNRAHPAHVGTHNGDGFAFDHGFQRHDHCGGGIANDSAALAQFGLGTKGLFDFAHLNGNGAPAQGLVFQQYLQGFLFRRQGFVLGLDFHLFKFAQLAQTHVQDSFGLRIGELEGFDH